MSFFNLDKNNKLILSADSLSLPLIRKIWDKDKTKEKKTAIDMISYVYFISDNKSPYMHYPKEERIKQLNLDLFGKEDWSPPPEVEGAIIYYKKISETTSTRLLSSARVACYKLAGYFKNVNFEPLSEQEAEERETRLVYTAADVAKNLQAIGKIIDSLDVLEEKVKKEQSSKVKLRGGGKVGDYER